jgi:hypothetical protein
LRIQKENDNSIETSDEHDTKVNEDTFNEEGKCISNNDQFSFVTTQSCWVVCPPTRFWPFQVLATFDTSCVLMIGGWWHWILNPWKNYTSWISGMHCNLKTERLVSWSGEKRPWQNDTLQLLYCSKRRWVVQQWQGYHNCLGNPKEGIRYLKSKEKCKRLLEEDWRSSLQQYSRSRQQH